LCHGDDGDAVDLNQIGSNRRGFAQGKKKSRRSPAYVTATGVSRTGAERRQESSAWLGQIASRRKVTAWRNLRVRELFFVKLW
jgi:hypothetical protein